MQVKVITEPQEEPVTLDEAKSYLKVDFNTDDQLITRLIKAVRESAEMYTGLSFITKTILAYFENTGDPVELLYGPVQSISTVSRIDYDKTETILDPSDYYTVGLDYIHILVYRGFKLSQGWRGQQVKVEYVSGFGEASVVPNAIKVAILKEVAELYENRENTLVGSIVADLSTTTKTLLSPYKRNVLI
jgi:uncharacterized phiE125 gp8 family phage protein